VSAKPAAARSLIAVLRRAGRAAPTLLGAALLGRPRQSSAASASAANALMPSRLCADA
jgi:hypothetical protein